MSRLSKIIIGIVLASIIIILLYFVLSKNTDPKPDPKLNISLSKITDAAEPVLNWTLSNYTGPKYGYIIDSSKFKSNTKDTEGWWTQDNMHIQGQTYTIKDLTPGNYLFRIRARDNQDIHNNFNIVSNEVHGTALKPYTN